MTFLEASRTTLEEFQIYNMAYLIQQEDKRYNAAIQAWFNQTVQDEFEKIFKKEDAKQVKTQKMSLADKNRRLNQIGKGGN